MPVLMTSFFLFKDFPKRTRRRTNISVYELKKKDDAVRASGHVGENLQRSIARVSLWNASLAGHAPKRDTSGTFLVGITRDVGSDCPQRNFISLTTQGCLFFSVLCAVFRTRGINHRPCPRVGHLFRLPPSLVKRFLGGTAIHTAVPAAWFPVPADLLPHSTNRCFGS